MSDLLINTQDAYTTWGVRMGEGFLDVLGAVVLVGSLANTPPLILTSLPTLPLKVPPSMVPVPDTSPLKVPPSMALPLATVTSALVVMLETVVLVPSEPMVILLQFRVARSALVVNRSGQGFVLFALAG